MSSEAMFVSTSIIFPKKSVSEQKVARRCHLRPCDTGGNSSEASTASSPHVALAGVERVRGGDKASTLVAPVARGHASCKGTEHEEQGHPQNSQQEKKENNGLWTLLII